MKAIAAFPSSRNSVRCSRNASTDDCPDILSWLQKLLISSSLKLQQSRNSFAYEPFLPLCMCSHTAPQRVSPTRNSNTALEPAPSTKTVRFIVGLPGERGGGKVNVLHAR